MRPYQYEFRYGKNLCAKLFIDRADAFAYGILIDADMMREVCQIIPNDWEKPTELQQLYNDYKTEQ